MQLYYSECVLDELPHRKYCKLLLVADRVALAVAVAVAVVLLLLRIIEVRDKTEREQVVDASVTDNAFNFLRLSLERCFD